MNFEIALLLVLYTTTIGVWIWARFKFFHMDGKITKTTMLYDPAVILQIVFTYYSATRNEVPSAYIVVASIFYFAGISLFLWTITVAKNLNFAFSDKMEQLVTTGPYTFIRHPLYFSYSLVWVPSALVFNSIVLWITLIYLLLFYYFAARREEEAIKKSKYSGEYREYMKKVGMFLPRIATWKS